MCIEIRVGITEWNENYDPNYTPLYCLTSTGDWYCSCLAFGWEHWMNLISNIDSILFCCQATACPQSTKEAAGQHTLHLCITRSQMA